MRHVKPLITLALACLLAVPALAMPMDGDAGRGGVFDQLGLTDEEKATMTLGELKDRLSKDQKDQPGSRDVGGFNMNRGMGPQASMPGMADAEGGNMNRGMGPQANMPGMGGAGGCNMNRGMGPQANMPGMAGADGCNMNCGMGPQAKMNGMGGADAPQQGMGAGSMNAPGSDSMGFRP